MAAGREVAARLNRGLYNFLLSGGPVNRYHQAIAATGYGLDITCRPGRVIEVKTQPPDALSKGPGGMGSIRPKLFKQVITIDDFTGLLDQATQQSRQAGTDVVGARGAGKEANPRFKQVITDDQ